MKDNELAAGLGVGGVTFIVLLVLKIANLIEVGWLLILTSIIWAPVAASIGIAIVIMLIGVFVMLFYSIAGVVAWLSSKK